MQSARGYESGGAARLHERFGYGYDAAWNLAYRTNNALVQTFGVNAVNELTTVSRTGTLTVAGTTTSAATNVTVNAQAATLYGDATFAREGFSLTDGNNTFTAIAKDSYWRQDTNVVTAWLPASASYVYDLNGNLLSDGKRGFEYDDENQLVRVTVTNAWKSEFGYDGLMRRRIRREYTWSGGAWVQTNEVRYVYDRRLVVQERDANNIGKVVYTRGRDLSGSLEEAGGIGGLLVRTDQSTLDPQLSTAYYHSDANGNVVCLINSSNAVVARYQYDPYGNILSQSGPLAEANLYRFSSKEAHPKSGLVYYLYRYYEPGLQRWVNRDPIQEEVGVNIFAFVLNDPVDTIDALGLAPRNPNMDYPPLPGDWRWCRDAQDRRGGKFRTSTGESVSWDPKYQHWDYDNGHGVRNRLNRFGSAIGDAEAHRTIRPTRPFPRGPSGRVGSVGSILFFLDILREILNEIERMKKAHDNGVPYWEQLERDVNEAENPPIYCKLSQDWERHRTLLALDAGISSGDLQGLDREYSNLCTA